MRNGWYAAKVLFEVERTVCSESILLCEECIFILEARDTTEAEGLASSLANEMLGLTNMEPGFTTRKSVIALEDVYELGPDMPSHGSVVFSHLFGHR